MRKAITFEIGNTHSKVTMKGSNYASTSVYKVHNANVVYCPHNYFKVGDVVTMAVAKRGNKAADTFYSAILNLEKNWEIESQMIGCEFIAIIKGAKLKVA